MFLAEAEKTKKTRRRRGRKSRNAGFFSFLLKWLELGFKYHVHWDNQRMAIICPDVLDISSTIMVCLRTDLLSWNSSVGKDRFWQIHHFHCHSYRCPNSTRHSNACSFDAWMPTNDESRLVKEKSKPVWQEKIPADWTIIREFFQETYWWQRIKWRIPTAPVSCLFWRMRKMWSWRNSSSVESESIKRNHLAEKVNIRLCWS